MTKYYYHFTGETLRDGRPIPKIGEWLEHAGELVPCESGLHASEHPFDALSFAPGKWLHLVELGGTIVPHGSPADKVVAQRRKIVKSVDAEKLMWDFARRVALDVLPLWADAPDVVKRFLETGDESIRDAARAAAWDAAWDAARDAALDAARDAARAAARDAAWDAALDAYLQKYRGWFKEMVDAAFETQNGRGIYRVRRH